MGSIKCHVTYLHKKQTDLAKFFIRYFIGLKFTFLYLLNIHSFIYYIFYLLNIHSQHALGIIFFILNNKSFRRVFLIILLLGTTLKISMDNEYLAEARATSKMNNTLKSLKQRIPTYVSCHQYQHFVSKYN